MQQDILIQIGQQIKDRRRRKNITVQKLADKAGVSKGLISQIENGRTVPSLLVLINIIQSLDIDLNVFFTDVMTSNKFPSILVKRKNEYTDFEKEDAAGFHYRRIFTWTIQKSAVDFVLLELEPHANRPVVTTEAYEYKYVISGDLEYHFENEKVKLAAGDSILFDGRIPHTLKNVGKKNAQFIVVYFFEEEK